MEAGWF